MDKHSEQEQGLSETLDQENGRRIPTEAALNSPSISIVRSNTPRPFPLIAMPEAIGQIGQLQATKATKAAQPPLATTTADFPPEAPVAPPLPEEPEAKTEPGQASLFTMEQPVVEGKSEDSEFTWLFEYGLEMEPTYLNSHERLNGQAHPYGPAVLRGYRLHGVELPGGQIVPTLVKSQQSEQEVWGVLYRIPHRLLERSGAAHSRLDLAHPIPAFVQANVTVMETYRKQEIECLTYLAAANAEQNTEPLPVLRREPAASSNIVPVAVEQRHIAHLGWLLALAIYLVLLLVTALALAVFQASGYWENVFTASFTPLGAPWYLLLYGLLGGCISGMMSLGRRSTTMYHPVQILTWFARPFVGMILATLAYFLLNSGLFSLSVDPLQRYALFAISGTLAGMSERWLFLRSA